MIERKAFAHIFGLMKVTIPDTVIEMGEKAFENTIVWNVVVGSGIKTIPREAFNFCMIKNLTINNGVIVIEERAFHNCSLTSLTIPPSVKVINRRAFESNYKLKNVIVQGKGVDISLDAFNSCMLNTPSEENIRNARYSTYHNVTSNTVSTKKNGLFSKLFR